MSWGVDLELLNIALALNCRLRFVAIYVTCLVLILYRLGLISIATDYSINFLAKC